MIFISRHIVVLIASCSMALLDAGGSHASRLGILKAKGFHPQVIYDIGAYKGWWTTEIQKVFSQAQFFLFEANEFHKLHLHSLGFPTFFAVLGDHERLVTFFTNNTTGDSVFREQTTFYQDGKCSEKIARMTTLESLVQKHKLPLPDLIKIDVQGAEKLIIQGGRSIICHAEVVILETKILEYNENAPSIYEIMTLMYELGYRALDVLELHYLPTEELSEIDILFVKNDSALVKKGILK